MRAADLMGQRFGKLTVTGTIPIRRGRKHYRHGWIVACDCGGKRTAFTDQLRRGSITSCGCGAILHGHTSNGRPSAEYKAWRRLRARCLDPNNKSYDRYGGRGISVCRRWIGEDGFVNFLSDMGERPPGASVDRINNDGNYEPSNCRWATSRQQGRNRSTTKLTPDLVQEIHGRFEHGESKLSIANRMGIARSYINQITRGERWTDQKAGPV